MSEQKAVSTADYRKQKSMTILQAGNFSTTTGPVTNDLSLRETTQGRDQYGSEVVLASLVETSGNIGTIKPISAGTFAYNPADDDNYLIVRQSTKINNIANTSLQSGGSKNLVKNNSYVLETTRQLDEYYWMLPSGILVKGANAGTATSWGSDHAARPTRSTPGEFCWIEGPKTPSQKDYGSRTG